MSDVGWHVSLNAFQRALPDDPAMFRFHYGLRHGTMKIGLYAPIGIDTQGVHKQDELYIVVSGTGEFLRGDEVISFEPQDVLFVEAGTEHRFQNFTDDFSTWVVFWGPDGGERA